jgi:NADH-quinone oxidoreductase subunit L
MIPELDISLALKVAWIVPLVGFALMGSAALFGVRLSERVTAALTRLIQLISIASVSALVWDQLAHSGEARSILIGHWFTTGEQYHMEVTALLDPLSVTMAALTCAITGLIGHFSVNYLHREAGFQRFFLLLLLFQFGMMTLVLSGSYDLLFVGWELVGLTSVLLIAFFFERTGPTLASLRALITYRAADIGLLFGVVLVHQFGHSSEYVEVFGASPWLHGVAHMSATHATLIAGALLLGSMGKSAQFPLGEWLPRAMEGPTPSSALFYGALSVHAGVYLLLRSAPLLDQAPIIAALLVLVGAATAIYANLVQSVQADIKGALGYATMTQAGLMFVAIGLGFYTLATVHLVGHAILRATQLLRSPSALREAQLVRATHHGHVVSALTPLDRLLSPKARDGVYRSALEQFYVNALLSRWVIDPILALARAAESIEQRWVSLFINASAPPPPSSSSGAGSINTARPLTAAAAATHTHAEALALRSERNA